MMHSSQETRSQRRVHSIGSTSYPTGSAASGPMSCRARIAHDSILRHCTPGRVHRRKYFNHRRPVKVGRPNMLAKPSHFPPHRYRPHEIKHVLHARHLAQQPALAAPPRSAAQTQGEAPRTLAAHRQHACEPRPCHWPALHVFLPGRAGTRQHWPAAPRPPQPTALQLPHPVAMAGHRLHGPHPARG